MGHKRLELRVESMDKSTRLCRWILHSRSSVSMLPDCLDEPVFAVLILRKQHDALAPLNYAFKMFCSESQKEIKAGLRQEYQQHVISL